MEAGKILLNGIFQVPIGTSRGASQTYFWYNFGKK